VERFCDRLPMPAAYFELALRQFGTTQFLRDALLAGTGVSAAQLAEPGAEITLGQQLQQVRNLNRLAPAGWALGIGTSFHASTHGPLGFAVVSAATLGEALDLVARFLHVRNPSHRGESSSAGGEYRLTLVEQTALLEEERIPLVETFLLSIQALIEAVLARRLREGRFELGYAEPSGAYRYRECFHGQLRFGAERSALALPASLRAARSPFADPAAWASALPALEAQARRLDGRDATAARVEQLLQQGGDAPAPLAEVARRLGMSRRTLTRRLQAAGVGYRDLMDRHRRRRAEALLRERSWSVAEIGYRLGYEDAANFARACRRWFGAAPSALRRGSQPPG
jgi:AraC-like DNA-binding protein